MAISQKRSKRKVSTGKYIKYRKTKKNELGSNPTFTKIGKVKRKKVKEYGGNEKVRSLVAENINVYDPKSKKYKQAKIKTVVENPANRHFVRRNILTRGTIVDTEIGKAKITSRPGQEGTLNGILI